MRPSLISWKGRLFEFMTILAEEDAVHELSLHPQSEEEADSDGVLAQRSLSTIRRFIRFKCLFVSLLRPN